MRGMKVRLVPASRIGRRQVEDDANLASLARLLIRLDGKGTRQDRMIGDLDGALEIHHVRIMEVVQIASLDRDDRFVVREPFRHAVPEQLEADLGIVDVTCDDFPALPATLLLQRERHVEVVQVDEGLDAGLDQLVDHAIVEVDGERVDLPFPVGNRRDQEIDIRNEL